MKLVSPVSSEEVNPSGQGGVHISLGEKLSKPNQSLVASLTNPAVRVGACCTQDFLCQSPAQVQWVPPRMAQGTDTQNSPSSSSCEPLGHVRIKTQARLSDTHRGVSDLLWASSSAARA